MTEPAQIEITGPDPTILYRLYDRDGVLLYIGITRNLGQRIVGHSKDSSRWWYTVTRKTVAFYPTRKAAALAEAAAIRSEKPLHNVVHAPRPSKPWVPSWFWDDGPVAEWARPFRDELRRAAGMPPEGTG